MYHIEVLPTAKETAHPGWAYVPDTGLDPSKQPIVPSGARKRARISYIDERAGPTFSQSQLQSQSQSQQGQNQESAKQTQLSAREQTRIARHLAELDRENYRDVKIEVPGKGKDVSTRGLRPGRPMTVGVRRILGSQKGWGNYLDDEVARVLAEGGRERGREGGGLLGEPVCVSGVDGRKEDKEVVEVGDGENAKGTTARGESGVGPGSVRDDHVEEGTGESMEVEEPQPTSDDLQQQQQQNEQQQQATQPTPPHPPPQRTLSTTLAALPLETAALITPTIPPLPSEEDLETLLRQPPLSWNQARAGPSTSTAPPRQFCEICGYWGRVRCMKCGQRVCGLECLRAHEEARCLKFYA